MKIFKTIRLTAIVLALGGAVIPGCKKTFLDEQNPSSQTTDNYYVNAKGFEDLVKSCYPLLRDITQQRFLVSNGTDMFTSSEWGGVDLPGAVGNPLDQYDVRLNSSLGEIKTLFDLLYREINRCNTVVSVAPGIVDMDAALNIARASEARFLRALCFFWAVQQWGDIPMPLTPTTTPSQEVPITPSADVYSQIITDLLECEATLPETASDYGRPTKGAAQFLLARVYLTRGWNFNNALGGSSADFTSALQYADKIITSGKYPLQPNYKLLFPQHSENPTNQTFSASASVANDKDPEIIFSVQYSDDVLTYLGDPSVGTTLQGNNLHSQFGGTGEGAPGGLTRTSDYNRHLAIQVTTAAMYRLFDPQKDVRYDLDFVEAIYALQDVNDFKASGSTTVDLVRGDTVIFYRPWNDPVTTVAERGVDVEGGTKKYSVLNTDEFANRIGNFVYNANYPLMWKFWQPGIPYGDGGGTGNEALFRSAEAYLIAAEAIVKGATGGALGGADVYYNTVLDRALGANAGSDPLCAAAPGDVSSLDAVSYRATPGNITIDMILDERARELLGENGRWYDLKRTEKLIERAKKYNPWTAKSSQIEAKHYLRPFPQSLIDNSNPKLEQNPGY